MNQEIQLTLNGYSDFRAKDIELLQVAIKKLGYIARIVNSSEMHYEQLPPFAAINLTGTPNETHLRYLRKLEIAGTKVLNPIYNSCVADDKALSNLEIRKLGIRTPKTIDLHLINRDTRMTAFVKQQIGFPCVVKYPKSLRGVGVHLVRDEMEFEDLFDLLYICSTRSSNYISNVNLVVQEFIVESTGRDLRVVVLGNDCLGGMHRSNPIGWNIKRVSRHSLQPGHPENLAYTKFELNREISENCVNICKTLGIKFAGIDILFGKNEFLYGEVNAFPGLNTFHFLYPELELPERIIRHLVHENTLKASPTGSSYLTASQIVCG